MKTVELKVFGQKLPLKADADDPELVNEVVALVTSMVEEVQRRNPTMSPHRVSLLALLDLAGEYLLAKRRTEHFKDEVKERSSRIAHWIETELG